LYWLHHFDVYYYERERERKREEGGGREREREREINFISKSKFLVLAKNKDHVSYFSI